MKRPNSHLDDVWAGISARRHELGRLMPQHLRLAQRIFRGMLVCALAADMTALEAADPMIRRTWIDFVFSEQPDMATRNKPLQAHIAWQQRIRRAAKPKANR